MVTMSQATGGAMMHLGLLQKAVSAPAPELGEVRWPNSRLRSTLRSLEADIQPVLLDDLQERFGTAPNRRGRSLPHPRK